MTRRRAAATRLAIVSRSHDMIPAPGTQHFPPSDPGHDLLSVDRDALRPLAERMRPRTLDEMVGQRRLLAPGTALRRAIESGHVHSMILWGPPGCGKTTLALLLAKYADAEFRAISAVLSGLPEVRQVLAEAGARFAEGRRTVLFVDEVHRFNKAQQDAFLPHIERGTILFVGATTENPSFELNSALLSRCRVHVMEAVSVDDIVVALQHALDDSERGLGGRGLRDRRRRSCALIAQRRRRRRAPRADVAGNRRRTRRRWTARAGGTITDATLAQVLADRTRRFDKGGEQFYDQISALHKSVRSSNPDAALYWFARMLDGGVRPDLPRAPADAHGGRGHRPRRSARAADGDRCVGHLRPPRQSRRRPRAGAGGDLSRQHREVQRRLRGVQRRASATCANTARRRCRCTCATRRRS